MFFRTALHELQYCCGEENSPDNGEDEPSCIIDEFDKIKGYLKSRLGIIARCQTDFSIILSVSDSRSHLSNLCEGL